MAKPTMGEDTKPKGKQPKTKTKSVSAKHPTRGTYKAESRCFKNKLKRVLHSQGLTAARAYASKHGLTSMLNNIKTPRQSEWGKQKQARVRAALEREA